MRKLRLTALLLMLALSFSCGSSTTDIPASDGGVCSDTWSSYGQLFFSQYCSECHTQYGSQSTVLASASAISSQISSGRMPQSGSLSAAEKARVLAWLSCGAQ
jgi:hypothetical protein